MTATVAKHTPGPWRTDPKRGSEQVLSANGQTVADCCIAGGRRPLTTEMITANARLIAAATELLALAENMIVSGPDNDGLLWLMFSGPDSGLKGALSVKAESIAGRALSKWGDARDAALAKAKP